MLIEKPMNPCLVGRNLAWLDFPGLGAFQRHQQVRTIIGHIGTAQGRTEATPPVLDTGCPLGGQREEGDVGMPTLGEASGQLHRGGMVVGAHRVDGDTLHVPIDQHHREPVQHDPQQGVVVILAVDREHHQPSNTKRHHRVDCLVFDVAPTVTALDDQGVVKLGGPFFNGQYHPGAEHVGPVGQHQSNGGHGQPAPFTEGCRRSWRVGGRWRDRPADAVGDEGPLAPEADD